MAFKHSWETNSEYVVKLLSIIDQHGLLEYKPPTNVEGIYLEYLKRYQLNLVAISKLIESVDRVPQMFLPMSTILRTIITDVAIHKYLRKAVELAGFDGFKTEVDILDLEYVKGMEKAFQALVLIDLKDGKQYQDHFYHWFKVYFDENRKLHKMDHFRKNFPDVQMALDAYVLKQQKVPVARHTEAGKLNFLDDANIERIKFLYYYLNQFHHYSRRSRHFFETVPGGDDYTQHNIDYTFAVVYFVCGCCIEIFRDIDPENPVIGRLVSLEKEMHTLDSDR